LNIKCFNFGAPVALDPHARVSARAPSSTQGEDLFPMGNSATALAKSNSERGSPTAKGAGRCRRKFLRFFPQGFQDETYLAWERDYKWEAHEQWQRVLDRPSYRSLLRAGKFAGIAANAVRIESSTNLLFSFEKMALRDALKDDFGARLFRRDCLTCSTAPAPSQSGSIVGAT
jgi:hypothetical protein